MPVPEALTDKYNVAAPRYTSYPTVPYWNLSRFDVTDWERTVKASFVQTNNTDGISLYVHLPYCESLCTYCGCNTRITKNHGVELPYIEAVLKEWAMYKALFNDQPVLREIHLGGGTPTFFSAQNLRVLIDGLFDGAAIHPDAEFGFEAHPGNTTTEHLQTLFDLGFRRLSLGIQDFNPKVQFIINRIQSFEQVKKVTYEARAIGYTSVNFDLIYGLPLQTLESMADTLQQVALLMPDRIAFYSYAHVPWVKPGQRRYTEGDLPDAYLKRKLYDMGCELFCKIGYHDIGMDHFALSTDSLYHAEQNGQLHRNFMGYTHQYTQLLIGLGVSSISDSWYGYAQNAKKVEDYMTMINAGQLPLIKLHKLTDEDMLLRRHILNIMCKGQTCWNHHTHHSAGLINSIERLEPLFDDGLIELNSWCLKVTPLGKRFLRNICMAFDERLWQNKPATQLFSMNG
ncbi:oxygen-independent coproporphyrinogen III oxidase [Mucilaginibacter sp. JRF]|uniref:oxygen-independent coproporphyrinogen III oxidase n=1 Tax=Mucilaginibacter sp. JRF TaxID=2780088 RepID=UPI00187EDC06|nr:oxygen-independent coproporphyrinogen III oxidase [Mucilaginibacter sp. JRF]MBE9583979.1 oxygen-independent coproporphyrinogen III oxidase [Mucilaginibacter sp. JRF]